MFGSTCKVYKIANGYLPYGTGLNYIPPCDRPQYTKRIMGRDTDQVSLSNSKGNSLVKTKSKSEIVECLSNALVL